MTPRSAIPTAFVLCLLCACTETSVPAEADAGPASIPDAAVADSYPERPSLAGSYLLIFDSVALDAYTHEEPTLTRSARLDLRMIDGTLAAVMTSVFGAPAAMTVERLDDRLVLKGTCVVGRVRCSAWDELWSEVELALDTTGAFAGSFSAAGTGAATHVNSTSGYAVPMTGEGRVFADDRVPEARLQWLPETEEQAILPWSRLTVRFSEGVAEQSVGGELGLSTGTGGSWTAVPATWATRQVGANGEAWVGLWQAELAVADWDDALSGLVRVELAPGALDPSDNAAAGATLERSMVAVGPTVGGYDFSDGTPVTGTWGSSEVLTGADAAVCESSACVLLGPITQMARRTSWGTGFAGRLRLDGGTRVVIRFRSIASVEQARDELLVQAVRASSGTVVEASLTAPTTIPVTSDVFQYASDWQNLVVELPPGADGDEVGMTIRSSREYWDVPERAMSCGVDLYPHGYAKGVIVQSVTVE